MLLEVGLKDVGTFGVGDWPGTESARSLQSSRFISDGFLIHCGSASVFTYPNPWTSHAFSSSWVRGSCIQWRKPHSSCMARLNSQRHSVPTQVLSTKSLDRVLADNVPFASDRSVVTAMISQRPRYRGLTTKRKSLTSQARDARCLHSREVPLAIQNSIHS